MRSLENERNSFRQKAGHFTLQKCGGLPTRRYEKICIERAGLHTIKAHMRSIVFNRFCRMLVLLAGFLEFSAVAQPTSFVFTNAAPTAIPRRASIILIVADGLGYGDLSCYGQTKFQTPNLDKLAAEGIRFTNYFTAADSLSSQAALITGKKSIMDMLVTIGVTTISQTLKNSGYHTGLIGEWSLGGEDSGSTPWRKSFDEFAGYLNPAEAENFYADYMFRYASKSIFNDTNGQVADFIGRETIYVNTAGQKGQYIPDLYTKAAINFIKNNQPDQFNHYRPFFLLLNYPVPKAGMPVPTDAPFSGEAWPQAEKNQAAIISRLDGYVGQLTDQLQKLGMTNNAVIFFTSATVAKKTNGVDPQFFHSNISTNDLRVPMIARWPGRIPAGAVSSFKWSAQDFLPTAAEIAFVNPKPDSDGNSVLPVLFGQTQTNLPAKN
jgi:arylsulfatase A-like enzyme